MTSRPASAGVDGAVLGVPMVTPTTKVTSTTQKQRDAWRRTHALLAQTFFSPSPHEWVPVVFGTGGADDRDSQPPCVWALLVEHFNVGSFTQFYSDVNAAAAV